MRSILSSLLRELGEGRDTVLATIISDKGSAPRGTGAGMLVGASGRIVGTIGGGAVELRSEQMAMELLREKKSAVHPFILRPNTQEDLGMQCGGDVTVLFEYIPGGSADWLRLAETVADCLEKRRSGWLIRPLDGGIPSLCDGKSIVCGPAVDEELLPLLCRSAAVVTESYAAEPLPIPARAVIFGCGHIAQALVPLLTGLDFPCAVLDNRPEYASRELFPMAEEVIVCDFDNISASVTLSDKDYVIVMTSGHAHDLAVEEQVLRLPRAYIGVVGSRRKIAYVNQILRSRGIPEDAIASVHTPIGLPIGAETPAEIAVSVAAELIQCRAKRREDEITHRACPMHNGG